MNKDDSVRRIYSIFRQVIKDDTPIQEGIQTLEESGWRYLGQETKLFDDLIGDVEHVHVMRPESHTCVTCGKVVDD